MSSGRTKDFVGIRPPLPYLASPDAQLPLGLCYVVGAAVAAGHDADTFDGARLTPGQIAARVSPARVFGLTATAVDYPMAERVARELREAYPDAAIVLGGPVQTAADFVHFDVFDCLVKGYADGDIGHILDRAASGDLPDIYEASAPDPDLVTAPHRFWSGPLGGSASMHPDYEDAPSSVLITSRGCPHSCAFCCAPALCDGVRYRDMDAVFEDVDYLVRQGVRVLRLSDDSFMARPDRVREWCRRIRPYHERQDVVWRPSFRVDSADPELYALMRDTGCVEGCVGVESLDPVVLDTLNKKTTPDQICRCLRLMGEAGIKRRALLMTGCPGSNKKTYECNMHFIRWGPYDYLSLTAFMPLPGSAVWKDPPAHRCWLKPWARELGNLNMFCYGPDGARHLEPSIEPFDYNADLLELQMNWTRCLAEKVAAVNTG